MDLGQLLAVIVARWKVSAMVLLGMVALGVFAAQMMPTRYSAHASMLVESGRSTADPSGRGLFGMEQRVHIATQIQVLGGERVAKAVAGSLKPEDRAYFRQKWAEAKNEGNFDDWLAKELLRSVTISSSREANVIDVTARAVSPTLAADIANLFIERYMDIAVELRVQSAQQYRGFFEQQAEELRVRLEKARGALTRFQQSRGILTTDDKQDVESARLADLSREVTLLEAQLAEATGRDVQARQRGGQMREVTTDPVIVAMRTDLQRARSSLSELQQNLGDNHPKVLELRQSINDQAARLERETARVTAGIATEKSVITQRLATLRSALQVQRAKVTGMSAARAEASVLVADVESAQRAYDEVVKKLNEMRLESQATQGNATLLEAALPPLRPSGPATAIILAISIFFGTLLGIASGLVRELFDRRVRSNLQLAALVDQPVLVTVPSFAGRSGKALKMSSRRALTGSQRRLPAA